ncbi:MAG TPA: methyltransferase [Noviherbaspirillum sp.]|nr:methyltransferase [Noviherbaspirillum sp.]
MSHVIEDLKAGRIPQAVLDEIGPFSIEAHNAHVASLQSSATYNVFGNQFNVAPGLYHPHPSSSSVFVLRTLLRERPKLGRLLEIGGGAGTVGLSLLSHGLADEVVLTDVDENSVQIARSNAEKLGLCGRATVKHGSMFKPVAGARFDSVLFNMPLMHLLYPGAKHIALDDTSGVVAKAFFREVQNHLAPGGTCFFTFSNISDSKLLDQFADMVDLSLVAAEWAVANGFWLMVYRFTNPPQTAI